MGAKTYAKAENKGMKPLTNEQLKKAGAIQKKKK